MITTSRVNELIDMKTREDELAQLVSMAQNLDILYVIGGDGSMRAAHALFSRINARRQTLSVVAIPKTTDNDILWVWQSFGFISAVDKAREFVRQLHTEASSNPRLFVMQLFGSESGFVISHAALASGSACLLALIPEVPFRLSSICRHVVGRLVEDRSPHKWGLVLMAETAIPEDALDYLDQPHIGLDQDEKDAVRRFVAAGRRFQGQTPDELRRAAQKLVSRSLEQSMRADDRLDQTRVAISEPRHLIRAVEPSVEDVVLGHRLGTLAVDNAMAGYTDFMISQWLTEYVLVPLPLVALGRKRVPKDGVFWKTVLASTRQPAKLT